MTFLNKILLFIVFCLMLIPAFLVVKTLHDLPQGTQFSLKQPNLYDKEETVSVDRQLIETVRQTLLAQPEMLEEALIKLEQQKAEDEEVKRVAAIEVNRGLLEESQRHIVVGSDDAAYTIVEFFDYNCAFCRRALGDKIALLKQRDDVRFVLKEFPVRGQASVEAARVSIALSKQDTIDFMTFHSQLMAAPGQVDQAFALSIAQSLGADMVQLEQDMKSDDIEETIRESYYLADELGLTGTPAYVVGHQVLMGAVGKDKLIEAMEGQ